MLAALGTMIATVRMLAREYHRGMGVPERISVGVDKGISDVPEDEVDVVVEKVLSMWSEMLEWLEEHAGE